VKRFRLFDDILNKKFEAGQGELCHLNYVMKYGFFERGFQPRFSRLESRSHRGKKQLRSKAVYGARGHPKVERNPPSPPLAKGAGGI
jgi:hypothetical protein